MIEIQPTLANIRRLLETALADADSLNDAHLGALIDGVLQVVIARTGESSSA